jgi:G3E family GTPase
MEALAARAGRPGARLRTSDRAPHRHDVSGFHALSWQFPAARRFDDGALTAGIRARVRQDAELARFKGVFRVADDDWILLQWDGGSVTATRSAWRRDSRAEAVFRSSVRGDAGAWERLWEQASARLAIGTLDRESA